MSIHSKSKETCKLYFQKQLHAYQIYQDIYELLHIKIKCKLVIVKLKTNLLFFLQKIIYINILIFYFNRPLPHKVFSLFLLVFKDEI